MHVAASVAKLNCKMLGSSSFIIGLLLCVHKSSNNNFIFWALYTLWNSGSAHCSWEELYRVWCVQALFCVWFLFSLCDRSVNRDSKFQGVSGLKNEYLFSAWKFIFINLIDMIGKVKYLGYVTVLMKIYRPPKNLIWWLEYRRLKFCLYS